MIYDPMIQTCLFDESWAAAGRRRLGSAVAPGECDTDVTAKLEQLKMSQSGELEQLEARMQSAHSQELEQLAVRLHASQRELSASHEDKLAQSAEWATQQQLELKIMLAELLSKI